MQKGDINLPYSKKFLTSINKLRVGDEMLANSFFEEGVNVWHAFQQPLFEEIKTFSRTKRYVPPKGVEFMEGIRVILYGLFMMTVSIFSSIYIRASSLKVMVFTLDRESAKGGGDFRLSSLYKGLKNSRIKYAEFISVTIQRRIFFNWISRMRPVVFVQSISPFYSLLKNLKIVKRNKFDLSNIDWSIFNDEEEKKFARSLVERYVERISLFLVTVEFLKVCLKLSGVKLVFLIDDVRTYNELIVAASSLSIETVAIQHGHYTPYHVGWLKASNMTGPFVQPNKLLVWNDYWKNELKNLESHFDQNNIKVAGLPSPISFINNFKNDSLGVLIPYETSAPKEELKTYWESLSNCPGVKLYFKYRIDKSKDDQIKEYGFSSGNVTGVEDPPFKEIRMVLGTYSTYLYDMIAKGLPVYILETSSPYGDRMVENGIAEKIDSPSDLCRAFSNSLSVEDSVRKKRAEVLGSFSNRLLSETVADIAKNF